MDFEATLIELVKHLKECDIFEVILRSNSKFSLKLQNWMAENMDDGSIVYTDNPPNTVYKKVISCTGIDFILM